MTVSITRKYTYVQVFSKLGIPFGKSSSLGRKTDLQGLTLSERGIITKKAQYGSQSTDVEIEKFLGTKK